MHAAAHAIVALLSAAAILQIAPPVEAVEEESPPSAAPAQDGADLWVPSLAIISGVTINGWHGAISSEICGGCTFPDPAQSALRPLSRGGQTDVTPYLGANFEMMTPELPLPTSPRLFVGAEVVGTFGFQRSVAGEGDPSVLRSPLPANANDGVYEEGLVVGQGSDLLAQLGNVTYGANIGLAFPLELFERQLRLKPSIAWTRYTIDVEGVVLTPKCRPNGLSTNCNPNYTPPTPPGSLPGLQRDMRLAAAASESFDAIGPGVDLELDTGRLGPLGTSIFLGARFFYVLGDRSIEMSDSASYSDALGVDQTHASWRFDTDHWLVRAGLGLRFQWLGPEKRSAPRVAVEDE